MTTFAPFSALAGVCPPSDLEAIAHCLLAAHTSDEAWAGLRALSRLGYRDIGRWLNGSAFAEYNDDGELDMHSLHAVAAAYLGEELAD